MFNYKRSPNKYHKIYVERTTGPSSSPGITFLNNWYLSNDVAHKVLLPITLTKSS